MRLENVEQHRFVIGVLNATLVWFRIFNDYKLNVSEFNLVVPSSTLASALGFPYRILALGFPGRYKLSFTMM